MNEVKVVSATEAEVQDQEWGRLTWKASQALGNTEKMTVGICEIEPGKQNPRHLHPSCMEIIHVLQGTVVHTFGGEEVVMHVGDTISVPAQIYHNARNIGEDRVILAISFDSADRKTVAE